LSMENLWKETIDLQKDVVDKDAEVTKLEDVLRLQFLVETERPSVIATLNTEVKRLENEIIKVKDRASKDMQAEGKSSLLS